MRNCCTHRRRAKYVSRGRRMLHNLYFACDQRSVQMHVFTAASPNAYGAVACVRIVDEDGNVSAARLLTAKSKVAPIKRLKLSRLELVVAVIESRLMNFLQSTLGLKNVECFSWTGSTLAFCLI